MQQTTAPQSFQKSLTNEVWATFPPTQITLTAFLHTDVSFSTAFPLLYCVKKRSVLNREFLTSRLPQTKDVWEGWEHANIYNSGQRAQLHERRERREKKETKTSIFFQPCCTRSVGDSTFPDTLKILGKSHMSQRRHSNNLRTIMHLSLIMQMRQGSRPVVCWHTVNAEQLPNGLHKK